MRSKASLISILGSLALALSACSGAPKQSAAAAPVSSAPMAPPASQTAPTPVASEPEVPAVDRNECFRVPPPRELTNLKASLVGVATDGDMEVLELNLPLEGAVENPSALESQAFVVLDGALPGAASVAVHDARLQNFSTNATNGTAEYDGRVAKLFVRRPRAQRGTPVVGTLYFLPEYRMGDGANGPAQILRFTAEPNGKPTPNTAVLERWARALVADLNLHQDAPTHWVARPNGSVWDAFAGSRIIERYLHIGKRRPKSVPTVRYPGFESASIVDHTMAVMSGAHSVYGALRNAEALNVNGANKPSIPLARLEPPVVRTHPYATMLAQLKTKVPDEPLAQAVPAEFWYLRSSTITSLFEILERTGQWGAPAMRLLGQGALSRDQVERYSTELGLVRSQVAKLFGPSLVERVALVGSDAYFGEGTDISMIFDVNSDAGFRNGVGFSTALSTKDHGGSEVQRREHRGVMVLQTTSKDLAVHQFSAYVGSRAIISNSWGAMRRIIDTLQARHASLSQEADFRFMLARDASIPAPILMYLSDRFIAEAAGPRQRILESRRVRAIGELLTPPLSAILYGYLEGRSPASITDLLKSGLLKPSELEHFDGALITFQPGSAPRSVYGTPAAATPLIELETPTTVTREEADAYRRWGEDYSRAWSEAIDPVALRLTIAEEPTRKLTADLRVLPLIIDSEYREFLAVVGSARVTAEPARDGLRLLMALDRDASWRRSLNRELRPDTFVKNLSFEIIGDWATLGVADHPAAVDVLQQFTRGLRLCQRRDTKHTRWEVARVPAYGGIAIANVAAAAIALTAIHREVVSTFGDQLSWDSIGAERGVAMTRVHLKTSDSNSSDLQTPPIFFALLKDAFYFATSEAMLRQLIAAQLDGKGPRAGRPNDSAPNQVTVDLVLKERGAFADYLSDLMDVMAVRSASNSASYAYALYRGVPELVAQPQRFNDMALKYFGAVPAIEGDSIEGYGAEGLLLKQGGTAIRPRHAQGRGRYQSIFKDLIRARASLAFDPEKGTASDPPARSLHTRVEIEYKK